MRVFPLLKKREIKWDERKKELQLILDKYKKVIGN